MGILNNTNRSEALLATRLKTLKRTIRLRGVECTRVEATNKNYSKVHGINNIDIDGDNRLNSKSSKINLVLNLNQLEHITEKGSTVQTVSHYADVLNEGDVVKYEDSKYTYHFKVENKVYYGVNNVLYQYDLIHLKTKLACRN